MEKRPRPILELNDDVTFNLGDESLEYCVCETYLNCPEDGNREIFYRIGLQDDDVSVFAEKAYGYEPDHGSWPVFRPRDYEAATRLVLKIKEEVEKLGGTVDLPFEVPEPKKKRRERINRKTLSARLSKLVIPEKSKDAIVSVIIQAHHKDKLMKDWGLEDTVAYGVGMAMLFYGKPGTGKTLAAHCIAEALGEKLKVVSAGELHSSEPGFFERKIQEIFAAVKRTREVLLIDECDGYVQDRVGMGQIMSAQNNAILTAIERHDGVVVLTTNRADTLDSALERRLALILEFQEPGYAERLTIWKTLLPKKMPLDKELSLEKLAEVALTGGQIKNVIVAAARKAIADEAKRVGVGHFESAVAELLAGTKAFSSPRRNGYIQILDATRRAEVTV